MSKVPGTLEEVQYEVLQGDLTANPKLQPSPIPAKDKELKTTAKKIIPAINELVKLVATCKQSVDTYAMQIEDKVNSYGEVLGNTLKKEQLEAIESKVAEVEEALKRTLTDTSDVLRQDYAETMNAKMRELENKVEELINERVAALPSTAEIESKIEELINERVADLPSTVEIESKIEELINERMAALPSAGTGGNELKREFISLTDLKENGTCRAPFKLQEVQDLSRQIEVLEYSSKYSAYIHIDTQYNLENSGTSIYEIYSRPLTLKVAEDGTITLVNTSLRKLKVYFYKLV